MSPNTRSVPQDIEAEVSILGGILLDNSAINHVLETIQTEDFYKESHRKIFKSMLELSDANDPIDLVTLSGTLKKNGSLEKVGGAGYLATLVDYVPTAANILFYCKSVKAKSSLRRLISIGDAISTRGYETGADLDEILEDAQQKIFGITEQKHQSQCVPVQSLLKSTINSFRALQGKKEHITGVPSGFTDLDNKTAGFQPGDLVIIAARPSMGKTALALNIADAAAVSHPTKTPTAVFSLEMSKEQLVTRAFASLSRVDSTRMRVGKFYDSDWPKLFLAANKLNSAPLFIDDTPSITIQELRAKARRLKQEHNIGLIIVDYLQLMRGDRKHDSRQQEISEISRSLKALAKELHIPVIALSQLNRDLEKRGDKRPIMSDLRESGAIEQDADTIMFVYREAVYCEACRTADATGVPCQKGHDRDAELIIAKQRNGGIGTVKLAFFGEHTRFENYSHNRQ